MGEKTYKPETGFSGQTEVKPERKITSPEEAAKMTAERRKSFGLGEAKELSSDQLEKLEDSIKKLLEVLDQYNMDDFDQDVQEEWYFVELEAMSGKDREIAQVNLERFLQFLQALQNM